MTRKHPIYGDATPDDVIRSLLRPVEKENTTEPGPQPTNPQDQREDNSEVA